MKALKVTVSGSYLTSNKETIDFDDVVCIIPFTDDERAAMHVRCRYAAEAVRSAKDSKGEKVYQGRVDDMRQIFIDDIEECEHDFSYVGKDIKKMSYDELQDLATAKDLRQIPLPKRQSGIDLREARERAYVNYSANILKRIIDVNKPEPEFADQLADGRLRFNFAKLPELVVDGHMAVDVSKRMSNNEIIEKEQRQQSEGSPYSLMSLDDLKAIADEKGIKYHHNIGFDKLHAKLYGASY